MGLCAIFRQKSEWITCSYAVSALTSVVFAILIVCWIPLVENPKKKFANCSDKYLELPGINDELPLLSYVILGLTVINLGVEIFARRSKEH